MVAMETCGSQACCCSVARTSMETCGTFANSGAVAMGVVKKTWFLVETKASDLVNCACGSDFSVKLRTRTRLC